MKQIGSKPRQLTVSSSGLPKHLWRALRHLKMLSVSRRARWPWTLLTIVNIHDSLERASPGPETPAEFWVAPPTLLLSPRLPPALCPSSLCSPPRGQLSQGYVLRRHMTEAQSFTLVWRQGPQLWAPTPDLQVEAESWLFGGISQMMPPFLGIILQPVT